MLGIPLSAPGGVISVHPHIRGAYGYGKPEYVALDLDAYKKNPNTSITADATREYDPKAGKWTHEIYIVCRCDFETAWTRTVEY